MASPIDEVIECQVIVVGAGISGLCAAKVLREKGVDDVLVLEANDRVGGRTWTVENSKIGWADLGGSYVRPTQNHLLRLIKEFDLVLYGADETTGAKVYYDGFRGVRSLFTRSPNIGFLAGLDLNHIFRLLDQLGAQIPEDAPWNAPQAEAWDSTSFQEFVHSNTVTREAREYMRCFVSTMVASESYQVSLLFFLHFVKQCGGTKALFASGGPEWKVFGGTHMITKALVKTVGQERILLSHPVYFIDYEHEKGVLVKTVDGSQFICKYLINATPPAVQQKIHYSPPLSPMRNQLMQRSPQGCVFKCVIYYQQAFWRDLNLNGCLVMVGPDAQFPMTYTFDDTKPKDDGDEGDGKPPAILGFIPADKACKLTSQMTSKQARLETICDAFAKAFASDAARDPVHYEEYNWMGDQYCGGGYQMTLGLGFLVRFGPYLREPVGGRIFFAGTECATHWSGYMSGAVQAGERAARQVLAELGLLSADEIDQVEPVSVDYPPPSPVDATLFERYAPSGRTFLYSCGFVFVAGFIAAGGLCGYRHLKISQLTQ